MSTINFSQIPSNINVPLFYISIGSDSSDANNDFESGTVLLGLTRNSSVNGDLVRVGTVDQAEKLFGSGSQLTTMVSAYRANNRYSPLYAIGQEPSDGDYAFCTLLIKASGVKAGTLVFYVAGRKLSVVVRSGDTVDTITTAIKELVDNDDSLPFSVMTTATSYVPLPVHRVSLNDANKNNQFSGNDQHAIPESYIQPGAKYKEDPRNSVTSSVYYIPLTGTDSNLYESLAGRERVAGKDIFINTRDIQPGDIPNPNFKGTVPWNHAYNVDSFDANSVITSFNYPGDIALPTDSHFIRFYSKWKGTLGNDYAVDLLLNTNSEVSLKDVQISFATVTQKTASSADFNGNDLAVTKTVKFVGGSGDYDYNLDIITEVPFHLLVFPENSMSDNGAMHSSLPDLMTKLESRWDYNVQNYGHGIGAITNSNDYSDYTKELPTDFRSPSFSMFFIGKTVTPVWECAAAVAGSMFNQVSTNPKLPYKGLRIQGIKAPSVRDAPNVSARERLLRAGISTTKLVLDVVIERPVTGDPRWRDLSRRLSAAYIATDLRDYVNERVGRSVISSDDTGTALPGSGVITPEAINSILVVRAQSLVSRGYLEQFDPRDIIVERDPDDPTRINIAANVDPTNPLYVLASEFIFGR